MKWVCDGYRNSHLLRPKWMPCSPVQHCSQRCTSGAQPVVGHRGRFWILHRSGCSTGWYFLSVWWAYEHLTVGGSSEGGPLQGAVEGSLSRHQLFPNPGISGDGCWKGPNGSNRPHLLVTQELHSVLRVAWQNHLATQNRGVGVELPAFQGIPIIIMKTVMLHAVFGKIG